VKTKPKKPRAAKKSSKVSRVKAKPAAKPKRKVAPKAKRRVAAKPKRKAVAKRKPAPKPKRKAVAKAKPAAKSKAAAAKPKTAPKPKRAPAKAHKAAPAAPPRRDGTGHLSPKYASELRALSRESAEPKDAASFIEGANSRDPLAEELGEDFVKSAVSGEGSVEESLEQVVAEERGGPFVETTAGQEYADGTDASNPRGAKPEPFPTT
jgi:hypothetical protein